MNLLSVLISRWPLMQKCCFPKGFQGSPIIVKISKVIFFGTGAGTQKHSVSTVFEHSGGEVMGGFFSGTSAAGGL